MSKGEQRATDGYTWKVSSRAKRLRITVAAGGAVTVTRPRFIALSVAAQFVRSRGRWLAAAIERMKKSRPAAMLGGQRADYKARRLQALSFVNERIATCNQFYGYVYNRVTIRNQKSRWGSCSRRKNLSFNYRILDLLPELADYLIVHELCHLQELNHSRAFWELVGRAIKNYRSLRTQLRQQGRV